jgi:putative transport protein
MIPPLTKFLEPMVVLTAILMLGSFLGSLSYRGFKLGSLGVLFIGALFGGFGCQIPTGVADFGLLIFVFAVGLQAGPRFFRTFLKASRRIILLAVVPSVVAVVLGVISAKLLSVGGAETIGAFASALTNTPTFAAAIDMFGPNSLESARASVSFGIVYPFATLLVVLAMRLIPQIYKSDLVKEDLEWLAEMRRENPPVIVRNFKITNPNCSGKTIRDLDFGQRGNIRFSRIKRGKESILPNPDTALDLGDIVTVIVLEGDLPLAAILLGEEITITPFGEDLVEGEVELTQSSLVGRSLRELRLLDSHHILITKIKRQGIEFIARGVTHIEFGDQLTLVGSKKNVDEFISQAGSQAHVIDETTMVPLLGGLFAGVCFGLLQFPIFGSVTLSFGLAGGAFLVAILMGHFGKLGPFNLHVPQAAKNLCRELGLILFLASTGLSAGSEALGAFNSAASLAPIVVGVVVNLSAIFSFVILSHYYFRENMLATLGGLCGFMTNATGLAAVREQSGSELPCVIYSAVYPLSLIAKVLVGQLLIGYSRVFGF